MAATTQLCHLPAEVLSNIASRLLSKADVMAFSRTCSAILTARLATCSSLTLYLDLVDVKRFVKLPAVAVLRTRTTPLKLIFRQRDNTDSTFVTGLLRDVLNKLGACPAVRAMQLEGVRGMQLQLWPWLADSMVACFSNLQGFRIQGLGLRLDLAGSVLTKPAFSSQLTHVDISTAQVLPASPTQVAAFVQASLSLHYLHVSSLDQLQVSLRDAPCSWRTLHVDNMESTTVSKLPLHAVIEAVHIGCLTVSTVYHPLAAVTAMATSFADGASVRPQVDVLNLSVFVATRSVDAYIAALQPLNGCFHQLQACWGDAWNNKPFDVAAVAAVAPLCGGIHTLRVKYALLQSSPQLWQLIVDSMPSITAVYIIQCNHGWVVDDLREVGSREGCRALDIYIECGPVGARGRAVLAQQTGQHALRVHWLRSIVL
ncbi:hypothetical protein V8C86DRAFT_2436552 [Haematococcus lacustris]